MEEDEEHEEEDEQEDDEEQDDEEHGITVQELEDEQEVVEVQDEVLEDDDGQDEDVDDGHDEVELDVEHEDDEELEDELLLPQLQPLFTILYIQPIKNYLLYNKKILSYKPATEPISLNVSSYAPKLRHSSSLNPTCLECFFVFFFIMLIGFFEGCG